MTRILLIALFAISWAPAIAQTVTGLDRPATFMVRELVQNIVVPAVALRPSKERTVLRQVEIRVEPGGPFPGPRAGVPNGQRLILLPEIFVLQLLGHVEATVYAEVSNQPHFAEWWLDYTLWRSPVFDRISDGPFYRGAAPNAPLVFAGMTVDQAGAFAAQYRATISEMFNAALIDILLHELGHHSIDRWYNSEQTPPTEARAIERAADAWAASAYEDLVNAYPNTGGFDKRNVAGRLFAIEYVFGLTRWRSTAQVGSGATHPPFITRVSSVASISDCAVIDAVIPGFCESIGERVTAIASQASAEANYRARAAEGEMFAAYRLGRIFLSRGAYKDACAVMIEAGGRRAEHYNGWCFEFSHSGTSLPDATREQLAIKAYQIGANTGWADSIWGLRRLGAIP